MLSPENQTEILSMYFSKKMKIRAIARRIFECVGTVVELPQRLFDVVTAISGSGPAYFFLIFRALRDAGVNEGLPKAVAERLAVQTALGAACLADGLAGDLDTLMAQVASKGGTTEAALKVLAGRHLAEILQGGVAAATKRSKELSSSPHLFEAAGRSRSSHSGGAKGGGKIDPSGHK